METTKKLCQAKKSDASDCRTTALPSSKFCFFHDPAQTEKLRAARSFGGSQNRMRSLPAETPDVKIENCRDVVELVSDTINQIRKGQLDPRIGNALGYLSAVLIKAAEQGDMERRIDDLEALVKGRKHTMDCGLDFGSTNGNT